LAAVERIRPKWLEAEFRHFLTAFGGGVLLSAVGLVLVPEGASQLSIVMVALWFVLGGVCFLGLDVLLVAAKRPASQAAAMLADFIPEALALGAVITSRPSLAPLLATMICLQNLPEGFNAYQELAASGGCRKTRIVPVFFLLGLIGWMIVR
jgi:ZIP family zinc transporter